MLGMKLFKFLGIFLFIIAPLTAFIGAFDVKWWAAVSGLLVLWNYINSKDFLVFLRNGKDIKNVPLKLEYIWQRNKLFANIGTMLFYFSLIISSYFEKQNPRSFEEYLNNGATRVYSMLSLVVLLMVLFGLIFGYYCLLNREQKGRRIAKILLNVGKKIGLNKFNDTLKLYIKAKKGELK
jgi:hypothetical protein